MKKYILLLLAIYFPEFGYSQCTDSIPTTKSRRIINTVAVPAVLIAGGLVVKNYNQSIQSHFNTTLDERGPKAPSHISDFTQFAPMAAVFALTATHKAGEHKFLKQLSLGLQSEALMIAMVRPLKYFTNETRPDGGPHSFPSGHTAQAFMAATFLHKEYGHKNIWFSIGGYAMATTVGMCRMASNRHWASDVLVGAGVGVLSTNMVYFLHKHRDKKNKLNLAAAPTGFYMSMKL